MADPVIERIAKEIQSRLEAVLMSGGYEFDVVAVKRPGRNGAGITQENYLVLLEQGDTEQNEELTRASATGLQNAWDQMFVVTCYLRPSDSDDTENDLLANQAISELTRAIALDGDVAWHTFGNLAINAAFTGQEQFLDESGAGVKLRLQVTYRTDEFDPRQERL